VVPVSEEVILAEERTTAEEKMHIIEGEYWLVDKCLKRVIVLLLEVMFSL
jgi:hypothetical protein